MKALTFSHFLAAAEGVKGEGFLYKKNEWEMI